MGRARRSGGRGGRGRGGRGGGGRRQGLLAAGVDIVLGFPPLLAGWAPPVGSGTPLAAVVAIDVVGCGPQLAARLRWRPLLGGGWAAAVAWTLALALIDGWQRGVAGRLATGEEYLVVPRDHVVGCRRQSA